MPVITCAMRETKMTHPNGFTSTMLKLPLTQAHPFPKATCTSIESKSDTNGDDNEQLDYHFLEFR